VLVYDSLLHVDERKSPVMSENLMKQICCMYPCEDPQLTVFFPEMTQQVNGVDCGLFALATATDVCFGRNPSHRDYVTSTSVMRQHLLQCLQSNCMTPFPGTAAQRRISSRVKIIDIVCSCRQPVYRDSVMIDCEQCLLSFHFACTMYSGGIFLCDDCRHRIHQ